MWTLLRISLGIGISANSVGNMNTAKSLQKGESNLLADKNGSASLEPGSCLGYTSTVIHLLYN